MIRVIRRVFGAWLAVWLIVPPLLFMFVLVQPLKFIGVRFDLFTRRTLRALDSWIDDGRGPIDNGVDNA